MVAVGGGDRDGRAAGARRGAEAVASDDGGGDDDAVCSGPVPTLASLHCDAIRSALLRSEQPTTVTVARTLPATTLIIWWGGWW